MGTQVVPRKRLAAGSWGAGCMASLLVAARRPENKQRYMQRKRRARRLIASSSTQVSETSFTQSQMSYTITQACCQTGQTRYSDRGRMSSFINIFTLTTCGGLSGAEWPPPTMLLTYRMSLRCRPILDGLWLVFFLLRYTTDVRRNIISWLAKLHRPGGTMHPEWCDVPERLARSSVERCGFKFDRGLGKMGRR